MSEIFIEAIKSTWDELLVHAVNSKAFGDGESVN